MPIYEYRCEACGTREELLEGLSAPEQHDCPACKAAAGMRRQLSVSAFSMGGGAFPAPSPAPASAPPCAGGCSCPYAH